MRVPVPVELGASIGVLEDNNTHLTIYRTVLGRAGYRCQIEGTVQAFLARCEAQPFDLLLLDWELPDGNATDVIRWARGRAGWNPVIVVASLHTEEHRVVEALALGADDFVFKPVRMQELLARLTAHLRKAGTATPSSLELAPYVLDTVQRQVLDAGKPVLLTDKEFDLLEHLCQRREQLVSRQKLLSAVWGVTADVDTRTVDAHVSRLRRKLGLGSTCRWSIVAAYGQGYRLTLSAEKD